MVRHFPRLDTSVGVAEGSLPAQVPSLTTVIIIVRPEFVNAQVLNPPLTPTLSPFIKGERVRDSNRLPFFANFGLAIGITSMPFALSRDTSPRGTAVRYVKHLVGIKAFYKSLLRR